MPRLCECYGQSAFQVTATVGISSASTSIGFNLTTIKSVGFLPTRDFPPKFQAQASQCLLTMHTPPQSTTPSSSAKTTSNTWSLDNNGSNQPQILPSHRPHKRQWQLPLRNHICREKRRPHPIAGRHSQCSLSIVTHCRCREGIGDVWCYEEAGGGWDWCGEFGWS